LFFVDYFEFCEGRRIQWNKESHNNSGLFEKVFGGAELNEALKIGFIAFNLTSLEKGC